MTRGKRSTLYEKGQAAKNEAISLGLEASSNAPPPHCCRLTAVTSLPPPALPPALSLPPPHCRRLTAATSTAARAARLPPHTQLADEPDEPGGAAACASHTHTWVKPTPNPTLQDAKLAVRCTGSCGNQKFWKRWQVLHQRMGEGKDVTLCNTCFLSRINLKASAPPALALAPSA